MFYSSVVIVSAFFVHASFLFPSLSSVSRFRCKMVLRAIQRYGSKYFSNFRKKKIFTLFFPRSEESILLPLKMLKIASTKSALKLYALQLIIRDFTFVNYFSPRSGALNFLSLILFVFVHQRSNFAERTKETELLVAKTRDVCRVKIFLQTF